MERNIAKQVPAGWRAAHFARHFPHTQRIRNWLTAYSEQHGFKIDLNRISITQDGTSTVKYSLGIN